ncbi:MAG: DUF1501 domain-containing protein [Paracoccaceae bacterium]
MSTSISRRSFLMRTGAVGCSLAASPLVTPVSFAAMPGANRLVVIILRGGMDGLDVVQPYGDPVLGQLRPTLKVGPSSGASDLDGYFALHPSFNPLMPLWTAGDLGFVHAVSTPYRDKRSHFDGQDLLEAGTTTLGNGARDGWLNRLLQVYPKFDAHTAFAIGRGDLKLLDGSAPVANWFPQTQLGLSSQAERLLELITESDPEIHAALAEAQGLVEDKDQQSATLQDIRKAAAQQKGGAHISIAEFAAKQLSKQARIAAFSLNGWDTHRGQARELPRALARLSDTILTLKSQTRDSVWQKTTIVALTEFGRTVRENGTTGTDHGTGGLMIMAGGAVRGGRVHGDWPGLAEGDLYDGRDLLPTRDIRANLAWLMRGLFGLDQSVLEGTVFPGLDMGRDPGLIL